MFSPASLPAGSVSGATTFTLTTTAHSAVAPDFWHLPAFHPFMGVWFTILALMALLADRTRRNGRRYGLRLLGSGALLMVCGMLIAGCNGVTTGVAAPPATSATGTSAGTYTITVTATTGSATRTATVTLIVQ
jgi:hypothetical protein